MINIDRMIEEIYNINCNKQECEKCKIGMKTEWCPKSYCDDLIEARTELGKSEKDIKRIYNKLIKEKAV